MIRVGFIGNGKSTHRYHLPFMDKDKYEVVGIYSRSDNKFEMEYLKEYIKYDDVDEFLKLDVDVVIITTPAQYHYHYAKLCLENEKNIIVDKPFCDTVVECNELFSIAKKKDLKILPYQNRRYDSDFLTFKNIISTINLNEIMEIESNHTHYRVDGANHRGGKYDGSIYGHAVHFIDQIVSIFGEPTDLIYDVCNQKNLFIGDKNKMEDYLPEDYYDIKLIYNNLRIRVRFSQLTIKEPPRWIINTVNNTFEKYKIDQQERDLKLCIFPDETSFGVDLKDSQFKKYNLDGTYTNIDTIYLGYKKYYDDMYDILNDQKDIIVTQKQLTTVLNILDTIVDKKSFKKLY